jgi:hypothetical protein
LVRPAAEVGPSAGELTQLLLDTLANHLADTWRSWSRYDVPQFAPSTVLSASGLLGRSYLDQIAWRSIPSADSARVRRLANGADLDRAGVDPDGWLVAIPNDPSWFVCEWPI